ncbi:MAG: hypothetical protein ABJH68_20970 [Ilumatobacter sp.]|uniref:hypothetical protein n=1 Tax=Ilumatobacter sp. TaxID=1967498 RepID=UPI00329A0847
MTTIDVGTPRRQQLVMVVGAAVMAAFGLLVVAAVPFGDNGELPLVAKVAAVVIGSVMVLPFLGVLALRKRIAEPRALTIDSAGIRYDAGPTLSFDTKWSELAQVRASYARKPSTARSPWSWRGLRDDAPPGGSPEKKLLVSTYARLDLIPNDDGFGDRHPTTRRFTRTMPDPDSDDAPRQAIVRIPFGNLPHVVGLIDRALHEHAGDAYHPPVNEGFAWGFTYS